VTDYNRTAANWTTGHHHSGWRYCSCRGDLERRQPDWPWDSMVVRWSSEQP